MPVGNLANSTAVISAFQLKVSSVKPCLIYLTTHCQNVAREYGDDGKKTTNHLKCLDVIVCRDEWSHLICVMVKSGKLFMRHDQ